MTSSNPAIKQKVAEGKLCYICETKPPELIDEVRGKICLACYKAIQDMRLAYALQGGYIPPEKQLKSGQDKS